MDYEREFIDGITKNKKAVIEQFFIRKYFSNCRIAMKWFEMSGIGSRK